MTDTRRAMVYLSHMLEAAKLATDYVATKTASEFMADKRTQHAVIFNLMVLGEAATKLAEKHPDLMARSPEIAWNAMRGMRNHLVHGYFAINLDIVWNVIQTELPRLIGQLERAQAQLLDDER